MLIEYLCNQFYTNTYFIKLSQKAVLWIPDPDRHRHPDHADPDSANPDQYQFQANETVDNIFDTDEKDKTLQTGNAVTKK
jgi:hypothetical protein